MVILNKPSNTGLLRFGDKVLAEKRDSFIDSENESHRTGSCLQHKFPNENSWSTHIWLTMPHSQVTTATRSPTTKLRPATEWRSGTTSASCPRFRRWGPTCFFLSIVSYFPFQGGRGRQLFVGANVQQPRPPLGKATWLWTRWQDESECQIGQLFGNSSLFVNTRQYKFFAQKLLIQLKCVTR